MSVSRTVDRGAAQGALNNLLALRVMLVSWIDVAKHTCRGPLAANCLASRYTQIGHWHSRFARCVRTLKRLRVFERLLQQRIVVRTSPTALMCNGGIGRTRLLYYASGCTMRMRFAFRLLKPKGRTWHVDERKTRVGERSKQGVSVSV